MAVRSCTLGSGLHIRLSLVLLLYLEIVTNQACSTIIPFWYVSCYADFNISKLDLYNVSLLKFHECAQDCAETSVCWSFLFDSRHDTCASYRLKSTNTGPFPEAKYFLKYETEDTCTQAPAAECYRDANSGRADYAGRKVTTESGITCQRC
ncbi:uncharacterized protein LOC121370655 [Gigantopelta aegis]|uniref:uncharacterized protein LOC121370655 n=1 Tax=Gigantopelta aegis TaxID=1735272 RepID=UPI001B88C038|nr:uncharacterized protein LOC121370655 [Gigantopelta aegis]